MMRAVVFGLSLSTLAALVCEDLSSCEGCVASKNENAPACKPWGPKKCTRKNNKDEWEAEWCPGDPCEEFPECDCVGEKANGARKCLKARDEAQCDAKDERVKWTTSWCASPPTNPSPAAIVDCFQNSGDCGECCPACTAVDTDSFASHFARYSYDYHPTDTTRCICLDLDNSVDNKVIDLTPYSDCARITGDSIRVFGMEGNDAMYTNGESNELQGEGGDDHLAAGGSYNYLYGGAGDAYGDGGVDVCTDLSGSNTIDYCEYRRKLTDTPKLTHTAAGTKAPAARA